MLIAAWLALPGRRLASGLYRTVRDRQSVDVGRLRDVQAI